MGHTKLSGILGSGMVIQRNEKFHIWGTEDTLNVVKVVFENNIYESEVIDGKFDVVVDGHQEGTGFEIKVIGSEEITLTDVLFGDVFMLAGQSNMQLPVYRTRDAAGEEIDSANYPTIRQFTLNPNYRLDETKEAELFEEKWFSAVKGEIELMSAVGFFCAKNLQSKINVPIGLILNAQGGSNIESWMSAKSLEEFGDFTHYIDMFQEDGSLQAYLDENNKATADWRNELLDEGFEKRALAIPDDAFEVTLPGIFMDKDGDGFTGSMWLYKKIVLDFEPEEDSFIYVGELMDSDKTYINGVMVGNTEYCYPPRKYPFSGSILKKGENLIAVRLLVDNKNGGFLLDHPYYLRSGDKKISIEGTWYKKFENEAKRDCPKVIMGQTVPTALYTASVFPIRKLSLKGAWWYQGESNAEDPFNKRRGAKEGKAYDLMFKRMVDLWRNTFNQDFPIVAVEMPDYINPVNGDDENWHIIQQMQLDAPKMVDKCAVVHARDLGQPYELHPQLKSELGRRMAVEVEKLMY